MNTHIAINRCYSFLDERNMSFDGNWNIGHVILVFGFLSTSAGLLLNYLMFRRTYKIQRLDYLYRVTHDLFTNEEFRKFFYKIDYGHFQFNEEQIDSFKESEDERHMDALLFKYDLIASLVRSRILKSSDLNHVAFEISQVFQNASVQRYLSWLEDEYQKHGKIRQGVNDRPFGNARWLVEEIMEE